MILDQIVKDKQIELEAIKKKVPLARLQEIVEKQAPSLDFTSAIRSSDISLIAEVKKASPSRGVIRPRFDSVAIARTYADSGVSAISILTETKYFQGKLVYINDIKKALGEKCVPLLRKDFLTDPYQIYESRAYGADCLLLIVAILTPRKLDELIGLSYELGMSCLVEVHNEAEMKIALKSKARIIGINNRDLRTFKVDIKTTERLRPLVPLDKIVVSESGIKDRSDIEKMRDWDIDAVLVGETLMTAPDISEKLKELLELAYPPMQSNIRQEWSKQ
jgi:indole-3-glycerol phosphate synthase